MKQPWSGNQLEAARRPSLPVRRIAVLSDLHLRADGPSEVQRAYEGLLRRVMDDVLLAAPDLVLVPGDFTEHGEAAEYQAVRRLMDTIRAPVRWVPGNHEVGEKGTACAERLAQYEGFAGSPCYVEPLPGIVLVGLNSSLFGSQTGAERQQWTTLENVAQAWSGLPLLLMLHYPLFLDDPGEPGGTYWTVEPASRARLLEMLRAFPATLVVSGHLHRPLYRVLGPITFLGAPSLAFGLPPDVTPEGWLLVEWGEDHRSVRVAVRLRPKN